MYNTYSYVSMYACMYVCMCVWIFLFLSFFLSIYVCMTTNRQPMTMATAKCCPKADNQPLHKHVTKRSNLVAPGTWLAFADLRTTDLKYIIKILASTISDIGSMKQEHSLYNYYKLKEKTLSRKQTVFRSLLESPVTSCLPESNCQNSASRRMYFRARSQAQRDLGHAPWLAPRCGHGAVQQSMQRLKAAK